MPTCKYKHVVHELGHLCIAPVVVGEKPHECFRRATGLNEPSRVNCPHHGSQNTYCIMRTVASAFITLSGWESIAVSSGRLALIASSKSRKS